MTDRGEFGEPPTKSSTWRRKALRWGVTIVVVGVVAWLFGRALVDNWEALRGSDLRPDGWWILAVLAFAAAVPATGLVWGAMVRALATGTRVSAGEAIAVQSLSWVLKYIPGQVGSVANKVLWAKKKGISRTLIVITFIYENVFLQLASIVPAAVILLMSLGPRILGENATVLVAPLLILLPIAAVLYAPLFRRVIGIPAKRLLKSDVPREFFLSSGQALRSAVMFLGPRVINGVGFVAIAVSVSDIAPAEWLPFAAAYALAGAIGILAFLVPSGLGVREAVIVVVLSQYLPVAEAIVISLIARFLSTIGDAAVALIYLVVRRTIPKEIRP